MEKIIVTVCQTYVKTFFTICHMQLQILSMLCLHIFTNPMLKFSIFELQTDK